MIISQHEADDVTALFSALADAVRSSGVAPNLIYAKDAPGWIVTLHNASLTDGSPIYEIAISSRPMVR